MSLFLQAKPVRGPLPRRRRWPSLIFAGLAGIAIVALGGWYLHHRQLEAATSEGETRAAAATEKGAGLPVKTARLSPGGILRQSSQIGSVEPYEEADLYAKISGYLKTLHVDYGDRVKAGQVLAEIDDPEVIKEEERSAAAVAQARAAVKQAEAAIARATADVRAADAAVLQSQAEIRRTASKRSYRQKVLDRYRDLVARSAETQQVVDEQEENLESAIADELSAKAAEATAQAQAAAARARLEQARADLVEAEAVVKVDEANHEKSNVFVSYTKIVAPYDGVITHRQFFRGAFIRAASEGQGQPLLSVARLDKVRVVTRIPDRDVPLADVGDPAEVRLDALPDRVFKGAISRFSNKEDASSRTMYTEIDLANPDGALKPGMSGITRVTLDRESRRATLPSSCVVGETHGDKADVYVIRKGKVAKVSVRIGDDDGLRVEVLEGLTPEDAVIVETGSVTEGMSVRDAGS